jgi:hypothetical protein
MCPFNAFTLGTDHILKGVLPCINNTYCFMVDAAVCLPPSNAIWPVNCIRGRAERGANGRTWLRIGDLACGAQVQVWSLWLKHILL